MSDSGNPNVWLYSEASFLVCNVLGKNCRLKSALYGNEFSTDLRKLNALACKTLDNLSIITETIKRSNFLQRDRVEHISNNTNSGETGSDEAPLSGCKHCLVYVILHDLLLSNSRSNYKIFEPQLCRIMQAKGAPNKFRRVYKMVKRARKRADEGSKRIPEEVQRDMRVVLPCYARVNKLRADLASVLEELRSEQQYEERCYPVSTPYKKFKKIVRQLEPNQFLIDYHLSENLLIFAPGTLLYKHPVHTSRKLVIQDKASCIVPEVLRPRSNADVLDACAAPGNKTLQLVEMMSPEVTVFAVDRDPTRFRNLCNNLHSSGVQRLSISGSVVIDGLPDQDSTATQPSKQPRVEAICQDFLSLDPMDPKFSNVESILLDPSCSGSGLIARQPEGSTSVLSSGYSSLQDEDDLKGEEFSRRLKRLSNLQAQLLRHALSFPSVRRVVYSTCSMRLEENEAVVRENIERFGDLFELETIWQGDCTGSTGRRLVWKNRGLVEMGCEACIRASPHEDLTNGFFIACFVRNAQPNNISTGSKRPSHSKPVFGSKKKKKNKHNKHKE